MKGRNRIWSCAAVMIMVLMAAVPVYGEVETEQPQEDIAGHKDNPKFYDGIVTDEMIDGWEQEQGVVYSTDLYGNELDWDMDGSGNEEGAGVEGKVDRMEGPTYGAREQEEILENIREIPETLEKGWLSVKGNFGEDWPGYNVTVALYDENYKRVEVTIYSQNDFEVKREIPMGSYKVYRAYVPGDESGSKYPLVVSDSTIEVEQSRTTELMVWRAVDIKKEKVPESQGSLPEPEEDVSSLTHSADVLAAVSIGVGALIFFIMGLVVYKRKLTQGRYQ